MRGGGVGFYLRENIKFKILPQLSSFLTKTFECLTIELIYPNKKIIVSNIYRAPLPPRNTSISSHNDNFINQLEITLAQLSNTGYPVYLFLDSNINLALLNSNNLCRDYFSTILTNGYIQLITKSTRIQNNCNSLIDHIITNSNPNAINDSGVIITDISDHFTTFTLLHHKMKKTQAIPTLTRTFCDTAINNFIRSLQNINWHTSLSSNDVDDSFKNFWDIFIDIFNLHFPLTEKNVIEITTKLTTL